VIANNFDIALLAIWFLVSLWRIRALIIVVAISTYICIQSCTETNFSAFVICSTIYFSLASANIKLPSGIRKAFIAFGVVYFMGAIDQFSNYHYEFDTGFDRWQPHLLAAIHAYVMADLFGDWRRGNADGLCFYGGKWFYWCKLHLSILAKIQAKKR
jgi:hypothetical protein